MHTPAKSVVVSGGQPLPSKWADDGDIVNAGPAKKASGEGLLESKWSQAEDIKESLATPPPSRDASGKHKQEKRHRARNGKRRLKTPHAANVEAGYSNQSSPQSSEPSLKESWKFVNDDFDWADEA